MININCHINFICEIKYHKLRFDHRELGERATYNSSVQTSDLDS